MSLTASQLKVWKFLQKYYEENGYRPSHATVSNRFGFSSHNSSVEYVKALAAKGYSLPEHAGLPSTVDAAEEVKAWRKAFRGKHFDGKQIVDT